MRGIEERMNRVVREVLVQAAVLLLFASPMAAADPPIPPQPSVIVPDVPPPPPPPSTLDLHYDQLMVVRANVDGVVVTTSPRNLVRISKDAGPVKVRAKFTDGDGTVQCRTFTEKWVYSLEPTTTGSGELLVVAPDGTVTRRTLNVSVTPGPGPAPPGPVDPLAAAIQAAYTQEADPAKAAQVVQLSALYTGAGTSTVNDASLNTLGDLFSTLQAAAAKLQLAGKLPKVQAVIAPYLAAQLGTSQTTPLDSAMRTKAGAAFTTVGTALGGVK